MLADERDPDHQSLLDALVILACCHTVICEQKEDSQATYNAESPDELALVQALRDLGFEFQGQDEYDNLVIDHKLGGATLKF